MSENPVQEFLGFRSKEASRKAEEDLQLWHAWDQSGRKPEQLQPLLRRYEPLLARKARDWRAPAVEPEAFNAELKRQFIQAAHSFDPGRGVAFNTHVQTRLPKAQRYNARYQNVGYIPEGQSVNIGPLDRAQEELLDELGRAPTNAEIAGRMGLPEHKVVTLLKARRKDIPQTTREGVSEYLVGSTSPRELDVIRLMQARPHEYFTPEEAKVFKHVYGIGGAKKITDTTGLAAQLGISQPKVSRLKTSIANKVKKNM
jgi:DNA-directed RNA polymerase specialized sigma subunit